MGAKVGTPDDATTDNKAEDVYEACRQAARHVIASKARQPLVDEVEQESVAVSDAKGEDHRNQTDHAEDEEQSSASRPALVSSRGQGVARNEEGEEEHHRADSSRCEAAAVPKLEVLTSLNGHAQAVSCLADLGDGRIASGCEDGTLRVWDVFKGTCVFELRGHSADVTGVDALDGSRLVSASEDKTLRLWDLAVDGGFPLMTLTGHRRQVTSVSCRTSSLTKLGLESFELCDLIVSGSCDRSVRVWDADTGQCLSIFEGRKGRGESTTSGHADVVSCVAWVTCHVVASGSKDRTVKLWELENSRLVRTLHGHKDSVRDVLFASDRVFTCSDDKTIMVWGCMPSQPRPVE